MKVSKLVYNNFKGNLYRYVMYILSNSFAVTAFFIFVNFIFHPNLDFNSLGGHYLAASGAKSGMIISQIVIIIFSIVFVTYSTRTFLSSRGKEFGLLSLYGMTIKQIRYYIILENTILSIISISTGIVTGIIFSKLFFMVFENIININLPFKISIKALSVTFIVFILLFEIIGYIITFKIKNKEINEQLKENKKERRLPKFSKTKAIIGIILLIISYSMAWVVDGSMVIIGMIPITLTTIIGTYFLFTQFCIYMAIKLKKTKKIKYNKINLITYSQIIFKLKDTAKVMFLASIMFAISFTATETIVSFYTEIDRISGYDKYEDLGIIRKGESLEDSSIIKKVDEKIKDSNIDIDSKNELNLLIIENLNPDESRRVSKDVPIISQSQYNIARVGLNKKPILLKEGTAQYVHTDRMYDPGKLVGDFEYKYPVEETILEYADKKLEVSLDREIFGSDISIERLGFIQFFILNDNDFNRIYQNAKDSSKINYTIYKFKKNQETWKLGEEIYTKFSNRDIGVLVYPQEKLLVEVKNQFATILFIAVFIAFLFFISSGSIIYFKLFNEIKENQIEYDILRKIGMTDKNIKKIVTKQIGILFLLPFIIGVFHSLFALKSLSNLLRMNLLTNGLIVNIIFLIFQLIYFLIIRKIYIDKIKGF